MHTYATNSPWHPRLVMFLTFVAIGLSTLIGWAATKIESAWGLPVGGVSAVAVFGLLYFLFEKYLWRWPPLRHFLLVPDLNGTWTCTGRTVMKNGEQVDDAWDAVITITQSWSKISVAQKRAQSTSASSAASLARTPGQGYRLMYHYDNSPGVDQSELRRHCGVCDLMFDTELAAAQGNYFTDRDRLTVGTIHLRRESSGP